MKSINKALLLALFIFGSQWVKSSALDREITASSAIDSAGVVVDSSGNSIYMIANHSANQIILTKTDTEGELDPGFGTSGVLTLTLVASSDASSGTNINLGSDYGGFASGLEMYMTIDSSDRIVLSGCDNNGDETHVFCVRLLGSTGALDTSFNTDGVTNRELDETVLDMSDLIVDGQDRPVVCFQIDDDPNTQVYVRRFDSSGGVENENVSASILSDPVAGFRLAVDNSDNVYVAGKHGSASGDYGAFCIKLLEASDLDVDTSFGTGGIYSTGDVNLVTDSQVFPRMSDSGDANAHIKLIYQAGNLRNILIRELYLAAGGLKGNLSPAPAFPGAVALKSFFPLAAGKMYFGGTMEVSGSQTAFIARLNANFSGDTTFVETGDTGFIANGVAGIDPTSSATVVSGDGGWVGYTATTPATVAVGFKETLSGSLRFVRAYGTEATPFLSGPTPPLVPSVSQSSVAAAAAGQARKDRSFSHVTLSGTNISDIDDSGVVVNGFDDVIAFFRDGDQFSLTVLDEQGEFETDFAQNGTAKFTIKASNGNVVKPVVTNFSAVTSGKQSYMSTDADGNIYLATQVDISGGNKQIVIFKVKNGVIAGNGILDSTFGTGGTATLSANSDTEQLEGLKVDSQGQVIILVHHDDDAGVTTGNVYRLTSAGVLDTTFDTDGKVDLSTGSFIEDAQIGLSLAVDYLDNIYVAGQYSSGGDRGFFCTKLNESDGSIDTSGFATSGTAGLYKTADFSEFDGNNMQTWLSIYQFDTTENIQLISRAGTTAQFVVQQISIDGIADTDFGTSGKVTNTLTGLSAIVDACRNEDGHLFLGGTLTDVTLKGFLARYGVDGSVDTNFGDTESGAQTGISKFDPTSTWTTAGGGYLFVDSGGGVAVVFSESKGAGRQLIVQRIPGIDDLEFDVESIDNGTDLRGFVLANHLNSSSGMLGFIHLDGIADDLQTAWEAVGGSVNAAAITAGINAFKTAMTTALTRVVSRASANTHGSCLSISNKPGYLKKVVVSAIKAVVSSGQYTAMATALNAAFDTVFARLDSGREGVTAKVRKVEKTQ